MFSDQLGLRRLVCNIAICHKMVPCIIGQVTDSKPQIDMCSPDIGRIMEYDTMKHYGMFTVR